MNTSGEAAEQVMRMSLEGAEILIKLTGSGAKNAAVLLYSIYKEQNKTRGKERLTNEFVALLLHFSFYNLSEVNK